MVANPVSEQVNFPRSRGDPKGTGEQSALILAKHIMTENVVFVSPTTTLHDLVRILDTEKISSVPVVDDDRLLGIVSDSDLLQRVELGASHSTSGQSRTGSNVDFQKSHGTCARDVMTRDVRTVTRHTKIEKICEVMLEEGVRRLPVVRRDKVLGIVSRSDIVHALAERPKGAGAPKENDDDIIRYRVIDTLLEFPGACPWYTTVDVADGIVTLRGLVHDEDTRRSSAEAIAEIEHVKNVQDRRSILQPY